MLAAAGCGAEAVPPEGAGAASVPTTARIETVTRTWYADATPPDEFRWSEIVDYARDRRQVRNSITGCREVEVGETSYFEVVPNTRFPSGKRWVSEESLGWAGLLRPTGNAWSTEVGFGRSQPPPNEYFDYVRNHAGEPERGGQERIRGISTTRYRVTLDRRLESRDAGWIEEIELWVDADGLVRKLVGTLTPVGAGAQEEGMPAKTVTTTEFFDFGAAVTIERPPGREVMTEDEWLEATRRQADPPSLSGEGEGSEPPSSCLH